MKNTVFILLFLLSVPLINNAQCNNQLIDLCLQENGGATYLKEFPVKLKKGKKNKPTPFARYTVALKKGSHYRFNIKDDIANQSFAVLTLSNDYKIYGSTYNPQNETNYKSFDFYCKNSGTYYITLTFKDKKEGCAIGMLSLVDVFKIY
ncbi:MAG: hypothetical protein GXO79_03220 [Chlorobi bacterium]|nr:hypothetical protein [Chlorobiota bacterium]